MQAHQSAWHRVHMLQYLEYLLPLVHQLVQCCKYVLAFVQCHLTPVRQ